ncbi:MAG: hypoxanthine phosphoribosyltransferase [Anaerolineae bacterium]|nr:hypoxanthine phosphoribosyltransferase [Anaerolineae bacterium]MCO5186899.1 hypoxanthine phosphoribosyltransferase [Anaerolineae bacterium]MCO5192616.1 hypoxanthine phosphoribosyltransferase [Anaerolineae bacterium]MCO5199160.1 hypoxanthine phosphoribosyltransferase [Anaerolineae bacterium]MCO5203668.1 hypoxanthine phosphoribosyltransferase [Anaerolineae bacterium]
MRDLYDDIASVLIDEDRLQARIQELAQEIEDDYQDVDNLLLLCVLKGAIMFLGNLSLLIKRPHVLDFMAVSSYGSGTSSSGAVKIVLDLKTDISDKHVLIVEDIIDSGHTLDYLRRTLLARKPETLRICTLLNKPSRREIDVQVDYIGFDIPDKFVVGYGLDFDEQYRNLPFIGVLKDAVFMN